MALLAPQSNHSQFLAPIPSLQVILPPQPGQAQFASSATIALAKPPSPTTQPLGPSTNYKCLYGCVSSGYQHDFCLEACSYPQ
jgi:hypothetical protein